MNLELIEAFNLSNMSYPRKFLFAGVKGSKIKFGPDLGIFGHISSIVSPNFLIFCMNVLSHKLLRFILPVDLLKPPFSILSSLQAPILAHFGHKNQHFQNISKTLH